MKKLFYIILGIFFTSCQSTSDKEATIKSDTAFTKVSAPNSPSISKDVKNEIEEINNMLKTKGHLLLGEDSIKEYLSVDSCISVNAISWHMFKSQKAKVIYYTVKKVLEYSYKQVRLREQKNSMKLIKLSFNTNSEASAWDSIYQTSPSKYIVENKPTTGAFIYKSEIFIIQTAHDSDRKILNELMRSIQKELDCP